MHRSIQPGMTNHLSAGKSCLECRRRKIKCDKAIPCSYCAKVKVRCAYPPRKGGLRTGGQNLPDQELASRVQDIERTLISVEGRLSQTTQLVQTTRAQPRYQNSNELNPSVTSDVHELQARPASPYQVRHLDFATRDHLVPTTPSLRPLSTTIFFLWQTYLKRVHPVLKIIHAPSFQSQIVEYLQRGKPDDSQTHCLLYAVSYAAIVALTTEECEKELDYNRSTLLQR